MSRRERGRRSRAPEFSPRQVPGARLWLEASLGITLNGSNVSAWADQTTNGSNTTQGTPAAQALYTTSGINGRAALATDGGDWVSLTSWAGGDPAIASVYFVGQRAAGGFQYLFDGGPSAADPASRMAAYIDGASVNMYAGSILTTTTAIPLNTRFLARFQFYATASSNFRVEPHGSSVITGTGSCGAATLNGITVGARFTGTQGLNGSMAEVLVVNGILPDDSALMSYFRNKWSIAAA